MSNYHPGYVFLGYDFWLRREDVPASLLAGYDRLYTLAKRNPSELDPESGRTFAGLWLDACDQIRAGFKPLLDRDGLRASLEADELRMRGNERALDAMFAPSITRP